jgi:hypothetical protein
MDRRASSSPDVGIVVFAALKWRHAAPFRRGCRSKLTRAMAECASVLTVLLVEV